MSQYTYLTEEGYQKLLDDIKRLETVDRPEVIKQIAEARDKGDLSENAEYAAAKEAQRLLEGRINELKMRLTNLRIVDKSQLGTDEVRLLNKVSARNLNNGKEICYTLVPDTESDLRAHKISVDSPVGQGLLGKKVGDIAEIQVPAGSLRLEILKIEV